MARYKGVIKNGERTEFVTVNRADLYFFLIYLNCDSHRFFIVPNLVERLPRNFFRSSLRHL
jgi:hypothetical protein